MAADPVHDMRCRLRDDMDDVTYDELLTFAIEVTAPDTTPPMTRKKTP